MSPLGLHRTAFMMKWKISGQGRRRNGRKMRSWSGKGSCYSKVSTSDFLMTGAQKKTTIKLNLNSGKAAMDSLMV